MNEIYFLIKNLYTSIEPNLLITPEIFKPARYLGNELGAKHKDFDTAKVRWVLTYPEVYEVGASNLGHVILYNIINAQPRQIFDRAAPLRNRA